MFCSLLLLGVKIVHLPSARLRKEIVKKLKTKETNAKEKVKEVFHKRIRTPHSTPHSTPTHIIKQAEAGYAGSEGSASPVDTPTTV